jgi:trk system potassium uptake protein TrkH
MFRARLRLSSRFRVPTALRLIAGLLALVVVGSLLLILAEAGSDRPLSINEAVFTAVSALSVTGLTILAPGRDLGFGGQVVLLVLIQIGGVGFMVVAVIVFQLLGRSVLLQDRLALRDSLGLLRTTQIIWLTRRVFVTVVIFELIGALLLWLNWRNLPGLSEDQRVFYALFHAVSAFCNAGFDLFNGQPQFPTGVPSDTFTLTVMGFLIVIGGLGIPVVSDLLTWPNHRALSLHSRITLFIIALLIVSGTLSMFIAESLYPGPMQDMPTLQRLSSSLFQTVSGRTAGYASLPSFELMSPGSQLTLLALMFIGAAPASMGGGITTGTFAVMLLGLWSHVRGLPSAQVSGRTIGAASIRKAGAVLTVSLIVVVTATWLILITHPGATLDKALFEVVSAFATCGLSLAFTSELNTFGQIVIMLIMFWGRLGALTIVVALAQPRRPSKVFYPEEQILIG